MIFGFTPVAEASVSSLVGSINKVVINPIIFFLFAAALAYFLYGIAQYLLNPDNEDIRKRSKTQMMSGIFGLFIMVAVFGIMNLILNTLGAKNIKIQNNGDYQVASDGSTASNKNFDAVGNTLPTKSENITTGMVDVRSGSTSLTNVALPKTANYDANPFKVRYLANSLCWQQYIEVTAPTEYQSTTKVKLEALNEYIASLPGGMNISGITANNILNFGTLTAYNPNNKTYYTWMDARAPKTYEGGTANDCVLKVDISKTTAPLLLSDLLSDASNYVNDFSGLNTLSNRAPGPNPFTTVYTSDSLFTRVIGSGANPVLDLARDIAIKNAYKLMGEKVDVNNFTIIHANILDEKYTYDASTGNYDYWVAIEHRNGTDNNVSSSNTSSTNPSVCCAYFDDRTGKTTYNTVAQNQCISTQNCTNDPSTGLSSCSQGGGQETIVDNNYCTSNTTSTSSATTSGSAVSSQ